MSEREFGLIALTFGIGTLALCIANLWIAIVETRAAFRAFLRSRVEQHKDIGEGE